jgi:hypothetical protein
MSQLSNLIQEGGEKMLHYFMSQAIPDQNLTSNDPSTWNSIKHIMHLPNQGEKDAWIEACKDEIKSLNDREIYDLVDLPKGRKSIKNRWVFTIKSDGRKKARLVTKGFSQIEGIDYNELFSPVVRYETVRILLALAALENWEIQALDVKTAFLYGKLDKDTHIYMDQPEGFVEDNSKVWKLRKALYGLKQASLEWWRQCSASMESLGFKHCQSDAGIYVFTQKRQLVVAVIYVDDALFMGSNKSLVL